MRRSISGVVPALLVLLSSCTGMVQQDLDRTHEKLAALQELVSNVNQNLTSLQQIVAELDDSHTVSTVTPVGKDGYDLSFRDGKVVRISYGKDGVDGIVHPVGVKAGTDGKWTFTSKELPKYRADGKTEIIYTADEEAIPGFEKVTEGTRITNTLDTVKITGEKTWDMQGYDATLMPESITVYIKKGNDIVETLTVTAGPDNKWTFSSSDLPKYEKGTTNAITYTVDEKVPTGFRKVVTGNNITNIFYCCFKFRRICSANKLVSLHILLHKKIYLLFVLL